LYWPPGGYDQEHAHLFPGLVATGRDIVRKYQISDRLIKLDIFVHRTILGGLIRPSLTKISLVFCSRSILKLQSAKKNVALARAEFIEIGQDSLAICHTAAHTEPVMPTPHRFHGAARVATIFFFGHALGGRLEL
jgi:hypothetical protein